MTNYYRTAQSVDDHHPLTKNGLIIEVFGNPDKAMAYLKNEEKCALYYMDYMTTEGMADEVVSFIFSIFLFYFRIYLFSTKNKNENKNIERNC